MTENVYAVRCEQNVMLPMRDGVRLAANLYFPQGTGPFPAIVEYTPYHKRNLEELRWRHQYVAERGYVVVNFDLRGTGDSEGFTTDIYADEERRDGYDVVEWAARQRWCNGRVGMFGISYCAIASLQTAMQNPPHLKAIIVRSGTDDIYGEWTNPGGSPRPYMYENYAPLMAAYNLAPPNRELVGERWAALWREHVEHNVPWCVAFAEHLEDPTYWDERSLYVDYSRIRCPAFLIEGWSDWYATPLLRTFAHLEVPKRVLIGPWSHEWPDKALPGPRVAGLRECVRWFDHWLKDVDTGMLDEPPVTVFIKTFTEPAPMHIELNGCFTSLDNWPPASALGKALYFRSGGVLRPEPPGEQEGGANHLTYNPTAGLASGRHGCGALLPWGMPLDQRLDEPYSLVYTTEPLDEDWVICGNPRALLYVASTASVAGFSVKICDVAPDGAAALVTRGYLNATHRNSRHSPELLKPGAVYALPVECLACAYRIRAGHRLRVLVANADVLNAWPTPQHGVTTLFADPDRPSRMDLLCVPVSCVPAASQLMPSDYPLPEAAALSRPVHEVVRDMNEGTMTVRFETGSGMGINKASYTVSEKEPAIASVTSTYAYRYAVPAGMIEVDASCTLFSDASAFHHTIQVEGKLNARPCFTKSWSVSVPRTYC